MPKQAVAEDYALLPRLKPWVSALGGRYYERCTARPNARESPAHGQYGSVQRTTRRQRSLKDDDEVLTALEDAGIDRERLLSVDRKKVDEALDVVSLPESGVYETDENEYVRKAEVDEERKETRLQWLKDWLAVSDGPEADVLRQEVERLE